MSGDSTTCPDEPALSQHFLSLLGGAWASQAIVVAAELGLADLVDRGPASGDELAIQCGCDSTAMHRLMRALCSIGVCKQNATGTFELDQMGEFLLSGSPHSLRDMVLWWGKSHWELWGNLKYSIQTGRSARTMLHGSGGFDFIGHDPAAAAIFNRAMAQMSRLENTEILRAYDFSRCERILDVGGGYGELLLAIMDAHPGVRTMLLDLEDTVASARARYAGGWPAERCEFVPGDFFRFIPAGATLHILKNVLHDWDDEKAIGILGNCADALPYEGRLLVIERVLPERFVDSEQHREMAKSDLTMLLAHGAAERTQQQFVDLADRAGLTLARTIPTASPLSVMEFTRQDLL